MVYVKLGSNIGSEFSGNHFCVILDNKDNKGKETVTWFHFLPKVIKLFEVKRIGAKSNSNRFKNRLSISVVKYKH